jgi:hypothetical protein
VVWRGGWWGGSEGTAGGKKPGPNPRGASRRCMIGPAFQEVPPAVRVRGPEFRGDPESVGRVRRRVGDTSRALLADNWEVEVRLRVRLVQNWREEGGLR